MLGTTLLWRSTVAFTYLKVKSTKCLCLLPVVLVLVLVLRIWSCLVYITVKKYKLVRQPVCLSCLFSSKFMLINNLGDGLLFRNYHAQFTGQQCSMPAAFVFSGSPSQRHSTIALAQDIFETHQGTHILQVGHQVSFLWTFLLIVSVVRGQNAGVISTQITSDAASQCEAVWKEFCSKHLSITRWLPPSVQLIVINLPSAIT